MRKYIFSAIALACASTAAATEYLPMNVGDSATFIGQAGETRVVQVDNGAGAWRHYTNFANAGQTWLSSDGTDPRSWVNSGIPGAPSEMFVDFSRPVGTVTRFKLGSCISSATIGAKNESVVVPAGSFRAVRLDFRGNCADGGTIKAWFAPNVGLVKWTEVSIVGPRDYLLRNASIGVNSYGQTAQAAPAIRVTAELPGPQVLANVTPRVTTRLKVENVGSREVVFDCPTTQQFDITITTADGRVANVWSADKRFAAVFTSFALQPGASKELSGEIALVDLQNMAPLDVGSYTIAMDMRCHVHQEASAFLPVPSYSAQGPIFVDRRMTTF